MVIAVMSDLHDNVKTWELVVKYLQAENITTLINCGDTCAPAMLEDMSKTFSGHIHTVFGNVADRELEQEVASSLKNVTHYGDRGEVELDGKHIFFNHFPAIAESAAKSEKFDLVCHGHTHLKRWEPMGKTMIVNPGTAGGMFQYPSIATINLQTMKCSFIDFTL